MGIAVIVDSVKMARERLAKIVGKYHLDAVEAESARQFYTLMSDRRYQADVVIIDIQLDDEDGFEVIKHLKEKNPHVPVIIVTGQKNRNDFIRGISAGAADYILKPYDDETIEERLLKLFTSPKAQEDSAGIPDVHQKVAINLDQYLKAEIRKAQKGNYALSIMLLTFFIDNEAYDEQVERIYLKKTNYFYQRFRSLFWDTDMFLPYGSQSFIGILPFCGKDQTVYVKRKVDKSFEELQMNDYQFLNYDVQMTFVTFPEDGATREELLDRLIDKTIISMRGKKASKVNNL